MATSGTTHEGADNILISAYTGLDLRLYTYIVPEEDPQPDLLSRTSVFNDLIFPSALDDEGDDNGYATIALTGTWSSANSIISYDHGSPDNPKFVNTGNIGLWDAAQGVVITNGTRIFHFNAFEAPVALVVGQILEIDVSAVIN